MTHICVGKLTIIGSDNSLSPGRRQAIIWTNDWILLIGPLGTNFSEILIGILTFSFKKMRLKVSSAKQRPFCLGLNVLTHSGLLTPHADTELGQNWLRSWFAAWRHQAITLTNADFSLVKVCGIHQNKFHSECLSFYCVRWALLKLLPHKPGATMS